MAYLIDGIHEDLNRVKNKQLVENIEDETKTDSELAQISWQNHLKRNQSIMVDLFQGQFKSTIKCPKCNRVSITFDPFNTLSLPIPINKEKSIELYVAFANNRRLTTKVNITYKKYEYKVEDLKKDIAKIFDGDFSQNVRFVKYYSYSSKDDIRIGDLDLTNDLRKKAKRQTLYCFEAAQDELEIPEANIKPVDIQFHLESILNNSTSHWRKAFTFQREFFINTNWTSQDLYLKIFKYCRFLWTDSLTGEDREKFKNLTDQEAFSEAYEKADPKPFVLKLNTNARFFGTCIYCEKKECKNCVLEYSPDIKLADLIDRAKADRHDFEIEVLFQDLQVPSIRPQALNKYYDLETKTETEKNEEKLYVYSYSSKTKVTRNIDECFQQFSVPEQLAEDNMWYCNKCKEHQQAFKKMEIYKAPPILIVHLKRFRTDGRASYGYLSSRSKIQDTISFPVTGKCELDLSPYVISKGFPMEYPVERIVPEYETTFVDPLDISLAELKKLESTNHTSTPFKNSLFNNNNRYNLNEDLDDDNNNFLESNNQQDSSSIIKEEIEKPVEHIGNGEKIKEEKAKEGEKIKEEIIKDEKIKEEKKDPEEGPDDMLYELCGIVNHFGSMGGGHYTAYAKNCLTSKWTEFDDSRTIPIRQEKLCTDAAYVLFYRKKNLNFKL